MKLNPVVTLVLATIAGVLEFLNSTTFGFPPVWYEAVKYGIFLIALVGVTAATGRQLGMNIANLLHLSPVAFTAIGAVGVALGAAVQTFAIGGVVRGVILAVVTFIAACFGPLPAVPAVVPVAGK